MNEDSERRYSRHLALAGFTAATQENLSRSSVLLIGQLGLGCPTCPACHSEKTLKYSGRVFGVAEQWLQPFLGLHEADASSTRIIFDLVAIDLANREITAPRV